MTLPDAAMLALQFFGVTSLAGAIAFLTAFYALPPNLSIEEAKDKGKHNFETRLIVRNIGKLPAYNIVADLIDLNFQLGGMVIKRMSTQDCGVPTRELAASEKMELPACPHVGTPPGTNLHSCDYTLLLKYDQRLPFFTRRLSKKYYVELRNTGTAFTWQVSLRERPGG